MAYEYSDLIADIDHWAHQSAKEGWIDPHQASLLAVEPESSANELFVDKAERPLIVAFLGGTGVGKSSLLNRLAGKEIAKAGVERPTSLEVTLYHHQSVAIHQLDDTFPLQDIKIAQHTEESSRHVIWIDMPDFDSTEAKNKDIVMQWLPFVDVLMYVVSPERYRDNKAWQLLLAKGASHAWLFVMNQWDRGQPAQYDDFKRQLAKAGFDNPIIYKTISYPEAVTAEDQSAQLKAAIESLATAKTVEHLESRGVHQRKNAIRQKLQQTLKVLGDGQLISAMEDMREQCWKNTKDQLKQGFEWPIKQLSIIYGKKGKTVQQQDIKLWDDWAQSRFNDYLDELVLTADQKGLPSTPLRKNLAQCRLQAEKHVETQTELGCRKSMVNPGNIVQRAVLTIVKICEVLLPLIAMGIVGYEVFYGYYDSALTGEEFLGTDFAVHSVLVILLSWLIPFFIRKKMQPSLEKAALRGLDQGLDSAMAMIELDVQQAMATFTEQHHNVAQSLTVLIDSCDRQTAEKSPGLDNERLARMLVNEQE